MERKTLIKSVVVALLTFFTAHLHAQFVHPGITHKTSDLDRMKYMVEAQIDPWYSSYLEMVADSKSSYDYVVQGDSSFTELGRDSGVNYNAWNSDIRAAHYNALMWYITGDSRHADKAIEIFNAWSNLTSVTSGGTDSLSGGIGYIMIEAAEIIKNTYTGWSASEIQAFSDMLVYPGYSTTAEPSGDTTFYWMAYQGDPVRHGNQGLSGWRTVMAMGIFLDNEIMYDRALRYIEGLPHRSDDLPYPAGPNTSTTLQASGDYADTYSITRGYTIEDYGYNELLNNYIWDSGQCQESSRDQQHVFFGMGLLTSMAEMAYNQGDDLYGFNNDRLLMGLEYNMRYNVSAIQSYSDQTTPWEPTVASGEFSEGFDRTGRWYSKAISPTAVGEFSDVRPIFEMSVAHYIGRGFKSSTDAKWIERARDVAIDISGYEQAGWKNDTIGWGALVSRRPEGCYGDPISGFDSNGLPIYAMNVLPMTIEAEHFDYSPIDGQGRTYSDSNSNNSGGDYRTDEGVDIEIANGGGYDIGWTSAGEYLTYTVYVPTDGVYDIAVNYAAKNSGGAISISFDGVDKTGSVSLASTTGWQVYQDITLASAVSLSKGVQAMRVDVVNAGFNLNSITITDVSGIPSQDIGTVAATGSAVESNGTFTIEGSGADIWNTADEFHLAYEGLSGDGEIIAHVASLSNTNTWAKAGVMIRESLDANSTFAMALQRPDNQSTFQWRTSTGGSAAYNGSLVGGTSSPKYLRLTRSGDDFNAYYSTSSATGPWTQIGSTQTITMSTDVYVGLAVTSHNDGTLCTATFDNVSIIETNSDPNVVADWTFDNISGSTLIDSSSYGNNGTITGTSVTSGNTGNALSFNGIDDTISIPVSTFSTISDEISISMWVNGNNQPRADTIFAATDASGYRVLNIHLPYSNSNVYWDAGNNGTSSYDRVQVAASSSQFEGAWNHWVFTKNATTGDQTIYLNGSLFASGTGKTQTIGGVTAATLGSGISSLTYEGSIDEVIVYDKELTASEVSILYNSY